MAQIHAILSRHKTESDLAFRERCGMFLLFGAHSLPGTSDGFAVARMTVTSEPVGLVPDSKWGLAHAGTPLPSDVCVIASYSKDAAGLAVHPFDPSELERAPVNPGVLPLVAHRMSLREFAAHASVVSLGPDHGRRREVFLHRESMGFSDAVTDDSALVDVHRRAVNNALYSLSPKMAPPSSMSVGQVLPTAEAIGSHLSFVGDRFEDVMQLVNLTKWCNQLRAAAVADGWDVVEDDAGVLRVQSVDKTDSSDQLAESQVWSGIRPHEVVARTMIFAKNPLEYARLRMSSYDRQVQAEEAFDQVGVDRPREVLRG